MQFNNQQSIFIQIAEVAESYVLDGSWTEGERVPSVRDLAIQLQVNPNTVMRAYEILQEKQIILNKRGLGFFVEQGAKQKITNDRKNNFYKQVIPQLAQQMQQLGISHTELSEELKKQF
jgi:GntR family transcriptional regulator